MNFNFTHSNEYLLNIDLIDEFISLYGTDVKLLITEKKNLDHTVFGDWSSIRTNNKDVFDVYVYPENTDAYESSGYRFGDFGFISTDNATVFISIKTVSKCKLNIEQLMSSLIIFPSNKIMEITDVEFQVPNINNLWAYSDQKSCYKLSLRTYEFKKQDEINDNVNTLEIENPDDFNNVNFDSLDNYFDTLLKEKSEIEYEAEVKPANEKPIINNDEKDPFGWQ